MTERKLEVLLSTVLRDDPSVPDEQTRQRIFGMIKPMVFGWGLLEDAIEELEADGVAIPFRSEAEFGPQHLFAPLTFAAIECDDVGYTIFRVADAEDPEWKAEILSTATSNPMGAIYFDPAGIKVEYADGQAYEPPAELAALCEQMGQLKNG